MADTGEMLKSQGPIFCQGKQMRGPGEEISLQDGNAIFVIHSMGAVKDDWSSW